ncbi:DUF4304 domain-containing protein [Mucilaginibacter myungsuensis]|uniref:DUF4304 domain-containing protein n=1 Tax=Mucilaginibacter myungsuensis TaxID=649104 RepID=A0A929PUB6_9SPHI|nr:DUF4304 domain-containing protein [Mucilaginibacter myungsuensis]MBE9660573.1 DUF4304 domain-containing protein [Mucilaginibacter myungsuensis]MDN3600617.1 DUF4304 domain-containing protein [Mucilaginibacter myungsuensis]
MERNLQDEYKCLIKDALTPALKKLGFKKNGQNFNRICDGMTQCLSIQTESVQSRKKGSIYFQSWIL